MSWTMLLLLSGDRAISSLAAETMIQKAGWERKSMGKDSALYQLKGLCSLRHVFRR